MKQESKSIIEETKHKALSVALRLSFGLFLIFSVLTFGFQVFQTKRSIETKLRTDQTFLEESLKMGDIFFITRYLSAYVQAGGVDAAGIKAANDGEWLAQSSANTESNFQLVEKKISFDFKGTKVAGRWLIGNEGWAFYYSYTIHHYFLLLSLVFAVGLSFLIFIVLRKTLYDTSKVLVEPVYRLAEDLNTDFNPESGTLEFTHYNSGARFRETNLLVNELSRLFKKIKIQEDELRSAEVFKAISRVGKQVRHDIQSPLGALSIACEKLQSDPQKASKLIVSSVARIKGIVSDLGKDQNSSLGLKLERKSVILQEFLGEILDEKLETFKEDGLLIQRIFSSEPIKFDIDTIQFSRAISNIINNSVEANRGNPTTILVNLDALDDGFLLKFTDNGPGVPVEFIDSIFSYGFTHGKPDGEGTGLFQARSAIEAHGLKLTVSKDRPPGTGAGFSITK